MANLRQAIRAVLPPIVMDLVPGTAGKRCSTWQQACARAGTYEADLINRFRTERHALRTADGSVLQSTVLSLVILAFNRPALEITDFGGGTGDLGIELLDVLPASKYTVVENPTLVALMHGKAAVKFTTAMPPECDVFFTSSTIQYIDDPMAVLKEGLGGARLAAVLARNSFSEVESFHVQRSWLFDNGTGPIPPGYSNQRISYPHRTIRESAVMKLAHELGFRCQSRLEEISGSRGDSYGKQLVFVRA